MRLAPHSPSPSSPRAGDAQALPAGADLSPPTRAEWFAVGGLAAAHAALFATLCAIKYHFFLYTDFDLAIFAQGTGGILRGAPVSSIRGMSLLGDHASLILYLIAPLYALARSPLTLLVLQSIALAAGAFPVWRLARRELAPGAPAVLAAALYLLYPALGYLGLFEFHPEVFAVPLLLVALEGAWSGALRRTLVAAGLALTAREDVALAVAGLALAVLIARRPRAHVVAGGLAALAALSLVVSFGVLRPWFGGGGEAEYGRMYAAWGDSPRAIVMGALRDPGRALAALVHTPHDAIDAGYKRLYWVQMLLPLAGLALLRPVLLLPALPIVTEHLLSSRIPQHTIVFQYTALVIPFAIAATVLGAARLARGRPAAARTAMLVAVGTALVAQALFGPLIGIGVLQGVARPEAIVPDAEARALRPVRERLLAQVPRDGAVVAGFEFLPRLAGRPGAVHSLHHVLSGHYTFSRRPFATPRGVVAVIADTRLRTLVREIDTGSAARWRELLTANDLHPVEAVDDLVLDRTGARDTVELVTPLAGHAPAGRGSRYGAGLTLWGADALPGRVLAGQPLDFALDWGRTGAAPPLALEELVLVDAQGRVQLQRTRFIGYTRAPVGEWPDDVRMRERYRLTVPRKLAPGPYTLAVRVWDRGPPMRLLAVDDPVAGREGMFTTVGRFEVAAAAR